MNLHPYYRLSLSLIEVIEDYGLNIDSVSDLLVIARVISDLLDYGELIRQRIDNSPTQSPPYKTPNILYRAPLSNPPFGLTDIPLDPNYKGSLLLNNPVTLNTLPIKHTAKISSKGYCDKMLLQLRYWLCGYPLDVVMATYSNLDGQTVAKLAAITAPIED